MKGPSSSSQVAEMFKDRHGHYDVKERFGVDPDPYLDHGSVVIAAITSLHQHIESSVMVAAGILAKKAVEKGLTVPPLGEDFAGPWGRAWSPTITPRPVCCLTLKSCGFNVVGYGCTTCIGNSGPLPADVSKSIDEHGLVAVSVLSGNRNFEGPGERGRAGQTT